MHSLNFSFLKITAFDVVDVLVVAILIYQLYNLLRGTIAANIFIGLVVIFILYFIVRALDMRLLTYILGNFINVGIIAPIVVFQQEIRRFLLLVGKNASLQRNKAWWRYFFGKKDAEKDNMARIKPIIDACKSMKQTRTGALIVFAKYYDEQFYRNSCEMVDAKISKRLLESIFQKNSPLHDGAVVISENKIKSASCILPLTDNTDLPPQFGLRHRAGIGVSEANDATRAYYLRRDWRNILRQARPRKNEHRLCRAGETVEQGFLTIGELVLYQINAARHIKNLHIPLFDICTFSYLHL